MRQFAGEQGGGGGGGGRSLLLRADRICMRSARSLPCTPERSAGKYQSGKFRGWPTIWVPADLLSLPNAAAKIWTGRAVNYGIIHVFLNATLAIRINGVRFIWLRACPSI